MNSENTINGDLSIPAVADTNAMEWTPSPGASVWRKRVHLVGPSESGQVTSVVRYGRNSSFPAHDHPQGEEFLVLEGIFSDEEGDWPAGSYLLNPEGYRHAPHSAEGCVIFVKLRQAPGVARHHIAIDTSQVPWKEQQRGQCLSRTLCSQQPFTDTTTMVRWLPGYPDSEITWKQGAEIFVLEGEFSDEHGLHSKGCWLRLPRGKTHHPATTVGCTFYLKEGGFNYLDSTAPASEMSGA